MRPVLFALLPLLAACNSITEFQDRTAAAPRGGASEGTRVGEVSATPTRVTFRMTDGARCVAFRPEGELAGWSGVTADCGYALPFTVVFRQGGNPRRFVIEAPRGPVAEDGTPGPRAEVFVTDVDGVRRLFIAPLGPNVRFETPPAGA